MSRYHRVRPRKQKHNHKHQQVPQPAAPAQPTEAQMEAVARERIQHAFEQVYKLHHGETLDKSIARCNRLLALHDRELDKLEKAEDTAHRWTVSPSMAFRLQREVERLETRQDALKEECWQIAKELLTQAAQQQAEQAQAQKDDSLCPPKQPPAPQAGSEADNGTTSNPSTGEGATAPPIAA